MKIAEVHEREKKLTQKYIDEVLVVLTQSIKKAGFEGQEPRIFAKKKMKISVERNYRDLIKIGEEWVLQNLEHK